MPHGRVAIVNGAVRKAAIKVAARAHNVRPSKFMSYNELLRRNAHLEQTNNHSFVLCKHLRAVYDKLGMEVSSDVEIEAYHASGSVQSGDHGDQQQLMMLVIHIMELDWTTVVYLARQQCVKMC